MDKEIEKLAEKIEKVSLEYGEAISNDLAWVISGALNEDGYRKPSPPEKLVEEIAEKIYEFVHRGKVHLLWNELPFKYGKKEYLELARSPVLPEKEMKLIDKIRNSDIVCCFSVHTDYNFCWWCEWSFPEKDGHKIHRTRNYDDLIDALKEAETSIFNLVRKEWNKNLLNKCREATEEEKIKIILNERPLDWWEGKK